MPARHAPTPLSDEMRILMAASAPSRIEIDVHALEVEGRIPPEIDGAFYRMGSDRQYPSRFPNDLPFHEDGCVSMFRFRGGETLRLLIRGRDLYEYPKPLVAMHHEDTVNRGEHRIHTGGDTASYLLIPISAG